MVNAEHVVVAHVKGIINERRPQFLISKNGLVVQKPIICQASQEEFVFTSAKTGTGVDQVFESMIRFCFSKYIEPQKSTRVLLDDRQLAYSQARCMCS